MNETASAPADPLPDPAASDEGVILVGRPNVGKSALFAALTKSYVTVSNYPGTTVEITTGAAAIGGRRLSVIDTPGAHGFIPASEDERVTRDILLQRRAEAVIAVGDAKNLEQSFLLALELSEMGLPFVLCLNMRDEARARGIHVETEPLAQHIGVPVVPTVAVENEGLAQLRNAIGQASRGRLGAVYPQAIEQALERLIPQLPEATITPRALGLMLLAGDDTLVHWLRERLPLDQLRRVENIRQQTRRAFRHPLLYVIMQTRLAAARKLTRQFVRREKTRPTSRGLAPWLERVSVHPVWSVPVLAAVLFLAYQFVGVLGAGTLVGWLEETLFGAWINPTVTGWVQASIPWSFLQELIVGPYGLLTMALTYAFALILPIVGTFFIAFGMLEDSGYLPRLAVVLNRVFKRMGLNGKAVLPMVLGLGCDTMATLTTRMLETRKERLIVIVLLSLGVPCSAQLAVILAMLATISPIGLLLWVGVLLGVILLVGSLAARLLPGRSSDFVVELPPLRLPRLSNILIKTLARIEWYLKEAVPLFLLGTLILFVGDRVGLLDVLQRWSEPVVRGWLGLPGETAEAFIIGFLRRDFGAAGLYHLSEQGLLSPKQVVVAAVTITLFIPCIAQFFMTVKERGWRTGLAIAVFVFGMALTVGGALNWALHWLPLELG